MVKFNFLSILITIGILGLGFFVWQLLIPLIQAKSQQEVDQAFNDRFFGYGDSQTIVVNFTSMNDEPLESNPEVVKAKQTLSACKFSFLDLLYLRGRMNIAIDDENPDDTCSSAIRFYKDNTIRTMDCNVPSQVMAGWSTWENVNFPVTEEIDQYCKELSYFEVSEDLLNGE